MMQAPRRSKLVLSLLFGTAVAVGPLASASHAGVYSCPGTTKILYNQYTFAPNVITSKQVITATNLTSIGSTVEMLGGAGQANDTYSYSWFQSGPWYFFYLDYHRRAASPGDGLFLIQYCQ